VAQFFIGIWRALTATGRSLALGTVEAWGFWSTTLLLLSVVFFAVHLAGGVFWRLIEGRLHPQMRDKETEAVLRASIGVLKAELYDAQRTIEKLVGENTNLRGLVMAARNHWGHWNAEARREMK
jgi:hypothetical protein